jgi:hypothetical protein
MRRALPLLPVLLLSLASCEKKPEALPAIPLDVAVKAELPAELTSDRLVPVTYELGPGAGYKAPDCSLTLFVHFVGPDGKKVFQDDHQPPTPSAQWTPGQSLRHSRLLILPPLEKATPYTVLAGLYCVDRPNQPFGLSGTPEREGETRYRVASGTIQPYVRPLSEETIGFEGWFPEEYDIPGRTSWRWMGREAKLILANRGQDSLLYLEGGLPQPVFPTPTTLRLQLDGQPLGQVTTGTDGKLSALYHLKKEQLGSGSTAVLSLTADQTFVPKDKGLGGDDRILGIMLNRIWFGPDTDVTRLLEPRPNQAAYTAPPAPVAPPAETPAPAASPAPTSAPSPGE